MNAFGSVAWPFAVCSVTEVGPASPGGVTAVTLVELTTVTFDASVLPSLTHCVPVRLTPVIVMVVPPVHGPAFGVTDVMLGDIDW